LSTTSNPDESARDDTETTDSRDRLVTWALAVAQLVSWGSVYYSFSLLVVPMEQAMGWSRTAMNAALSDVFICLPVHVAAIRSSRLDVEARPISAEVKQTNDAATQRALRSPVFWALAVCFTAYYATFAALTFHLVPLMVERGISNAVLVTTMALIGPAQVAARAIWFMFGRGVHISTVGIVIVTLFPVSTLILIGAGHSAALLWLFALCYGAANGMMTILRGTIVQDLMWTEGYGAVSGMLSFPSNVAKGVAPIAAASIWSFTHGYVAVEWTVFLVSILSAIAFFAAIRFSRHATVRAA